MTQSAAKEETLDLESIAVGIVRKHYSIPASAGLAPSQLKLSLAILSALRNERERAARIIKEHRESDVCKENCWTTITNQILGSKSNAD